MKKAGILTIAIVVLAVAGVFFYVQQKDSGEPLVRKGQGTLVREIGNARNTVC